MEEAPPTSPPPSSGSAVRSKWELVDYGEDSDDKEEEEEDNRLEDYILCAIFLTTSVIPYSGKYL